MTRMERFAVLGLCLWRGVNLASSIHVGDHIFTEFDLNYLIFA